MTGKLASRGLMFGISALVCACTSAGSLSLEEFEGPIPEVVIHPPFAAEYACTEHWAGQLLSLGDALGSDCFVTQVVSNEEGRAFSRSFATDGRTNGDWFTWKVPVLAPFNGKVTRVSPREDGENEPGFPGEPPAGFVVFENSDGLRVLIAHVGSITVNVNDDIKAGEPFAVVANNGFSRSPHVHIGAWQGRTPHQIRYDLKAKAALRDR
ncbi:M23 family metallopeptidase [Parvularcula marina]|uniref:M23 family peptidase n=1 Tax=Parvularcula marina TaxID=2292771 RepID=A0A371R7T9_9PROT|nr:M23 family metallopeptidase [Parvularcula marina]RFB01499.1 M23 family peptidase [Parvularcula marina]